MSHDYVTLNNPFIHFGFCNIKKTLVDFTGRKILQYKYVKKTQEIVWEEKYFNINM
jgi:hypothetical protein